MTMLYPVGGHNMTMLYPVGGHNMTMLYPVGGHNMTMLYPNPCYKEVGYKGFGYNMVMM